MVGKLPLVCVKTGLPAETVGRFTWDREPSTIHSGNWFWLMVNFAWWPALLVCPVIAPILVTVAFLSRHPRRSCSLPMTNTARDRLWMGRWGGFLVLPLTTVVLTVAATAPVRPSDTLYDVALTVVAVASLVLWLITAVWLVWIAYAYIRPGAGVPIFGVRALLRRDKSLGQCVELRGVHREFADAVTAQYEVVVQ